MSTQVRFVGRINVEPAVSDTDLDALDDLAGPLDETSSPWRVSESRRELIPGETGQSEVPLADGRMCVPAR